MVARGKAGGPTVPRSGCTRCAVTKRSPKTKKACKSEICKLCNGAAGRTVPDTKVKSLMQIDFFHCLTLDQVCFVGTQSGNGSHFRRIDPTTCRTRSGRASNAEFGVLLHGKPEKIDFFGWLACDANSGRQKTDRGVPVLL